MRSQRSPLRRLAAAVVAAGVLLAALPGGAATKKPEAPGPKAGDTSSVQSILRNADFLLACEKGDAALVRKSLKEGANPNTTRNSGATALLYAVAGKHAEVVRILLDARADPNKDSLGLMPLFLAAENGDVETVKALLAAGADVHAKLHAVDQDLRAREGDTALIAAASPTGKGEVVKALLAAGADVNARAENGKTALIQAAASENADVTRALLAAKPDVRARMAAPEELDALMLAVGKDRADIVSLLLAAGADPRVTLDGEVTLLEFAILAEQPEVAALLRKAGAVEPSKARIAELRVAAAEQS